MEYKEYEKKPQENTKDHPYSKERAIKTYKGCKSCDTLNEEEATYCKECGIILEDYYQVHIIEKKKVEDLEEENMIKNAQTLGIVAIVINVVFASMLIVAHIVGIVLSCIGLKKISKYKGNVKASSARTLTVIGLIMSIAFLILKIAVVVFIILLLSRTSPDLGTDPKYYFNV